MRVLLVIIGLGTLSLGLQSGVLAGWGLFGLPLGMFIFSDSIVCQIPSNVEQIFNKSENPLIKYVTAYHAILA